MLLYLRGVIFSETYSKILNTRLFQDFSGEISSYTAQIVQVIVGNSHGIKSCKPALRIQEYSYQVCAMYTMLLDLNTSNCKRIISDQLLTSEMVENGGKIIFHTLLTYSSLL